MAVRKLERYREKRDFDRTTEPAGGDTRLPASSRLRFVIQKHAATRLHFDLRLEYGGAFKSWAVAKGPSLDPADRRLAIEVEDHPLEYGDFEGTIPQGQYGGGTVQLFDRGYWSPEPGFEDVDDALGKGELKFVLEGSRLHGSWVLVRLKADKKSKRRNWLLIKHRDGDAVVGEGGALAAEDRSIASGRTMAEIAVAKGKTATPFMTEASRPASPPHKGKGKGKGKEVARPVGTGTMPAFIPPQLCKSVGKPPAGAGWGHEIKFDGYRMQLRIEGGASALLTRSGLDWSAKFPAIAAAGRALPDAIIDGEVVALDHSGAPDFAMLQAAISDGETENLIFFAFDLLYEGREDIRELPLAERKRRLEALLAGAPPNIRYVEHFAAAGDAVLQSACRMDLEGIVSKRLDAPYQSGRGDAWCKSKCRQGHEVVIGAWTMTGRAFRSLIAGVYRDGELVHVGRIGTGFGEAVVKRLLPKLKALETDHSPFVGAGAPAKAPGVHWHWVRPELVAEIQYAGFTADGAIRQASFKGLRDDKPARDVEAETPASAANGLRPPTPTATVRSAGHRNSVPVMGVTISHADKVLWPAAAAMAVVTKLDLARYLEAVGSWLIEHIKGRPCSLLRMPDGIDGERFFQRHSPSGHSSLFTEVTVGNDRKPYLQIDRVEALIAAAQMGAVELHPWNCTPFKPEQPGRLVFDLDPAPDVDFGTVVDAANELRDRLKAVGLVGFCKTTGGKGLHVVTPVDAAGVDWPTAKAFTREICRAMAADAPERFLIRMAKKDRGGRIFLDYLRNDSVATAVAPLSPRGRPGAPVSMPLTWNEVRPELDPAKFTISTVPALLRRRHAWEDYGDGERNLAAAIARLGKG